MLLLKLMLLLLMLLLLLLLMLKLLLRMLSRPTSRVQLSMQLQQSCIQINCSSLVATRTIPNIICVWRVFMMCFTHSIYQLTALYQLYQLFQFITDITTQQLLSMRHSSATLKQSLALKLFGLHICWHERTIQASHDCFPDSSQRLGSCILIINTIVNICSCVHSRSLIKCQLTKNKL